MMPNTRLSRKSGFVMLLLKKFLSYRKCEEFGAVMYKKGNIKETNVDETSDDEKSCELDS